VDSTADRRPPAWDPAAVSIGGKAVSRIGMGCNSMGTRLGRAASIDLLRRAVDSGVTFFDTADVYGMGVSEEVLGVALAPYRRQVVIATKFGAEMTGEPSGRGGSPAWVRTAAEASLRRLGTDHIDLYYLHRPDPDVPVTETLGAVGGLIDAGKVVAAGVSAADPDLIRAADRGATGGLRFDVVQNEYSLLERGAERGALPVCRELGIGFVPYFPLASGVLAGRYTSPEALPATARLADHRGLRERYLNDATAPVIAGIGAVARRAGHAVSSVAIAWLLSRSGVTSVIAGATSEDQLRSNVAAGSVELAVEDLAELDRLTRDRS